MILIISSIHRLLTTKRDVQIKVHARLVHVYYHNWSRRMSTVANWLRRRVIYGDERCCRTWLKHESVGDLSLGAWTYISTATYSYTHWVPQLSDFAPLNKEHPWWGHIKPVVRVIKYPTQLAKMSFDEILDHTPDALACKDEFQPFNCSIFYTSKYNTRFPSGCVWREIPGVTPSWWKGTRR